MISEKPTDITENAEKNFRASYAEEADLFFLVFVVRVFERK